MKETADFLRLPLSSVYCLVQRGKIPAIQIGGRLRIKKASLDGHVFRRAEPGRPTVLLVEEDRGLRELFRTLLKKIGFGRVVVETASAALRSLRTQKFDLMFLDMQLPDGSADEIYRNARQFNPDLDVIVITSDLDSAILDPILQAGPVTFLKKPLKAEPFNQALTILGHIPEAKNHQTLGNSK